MSKDKDLPEHVDQTAFWMKQGGGLIIEVRGGVVQSVYLRNHPELEFLTSKAVVLRDFDNIEAGDKDPLA